MGALLIGGCRTASGTPSRGVSGKGWRLSEGLREKIVSLATGDAARGVYMGEDFLRLRREEVQGVAPDRAALKRSFGEAAAAADRELLREIKEGDRRMLCLLAGVPYQGGAPPRGYGYGAPYPGRRRRGDPHLYRRYRLAGEAVPGGKPGPRRYQGRLLRGLADSAPGSPCPGWREGL